jgi:hypothetical protein
MQFLFVCFCLFVFFLFVTYLCFKVQKHPQRVGVRKQNLPLVKLRHIVSVARCWIHKWPHVAPISTVVVCEKRKGVGASGCEVVDCTYDAFALFTCSDIFWCCRLNGCVCTRVRMN